VSAERPRNTPEATADICERLLLGFGEAMRAASFNEVPTAILSGQIAGTRGRSLIIDLPGKPAAIRTCLNAVFAAVPYCIALIGGPRLEANPVILRTFRPQKAELV
jgi:molybdopterin adenylyltransferase